MGFGPYDAGAPVLMDKFVSIITVTYNASSTLDACIQSIANLKDDSIEFIVIDGASTDGTVELLRAHPDVIDFWISEPDKGIYDAMNKGLEHAAGQYILFLGADDILLQIPKQELLQGADLVLGDVDCGSWRFQHISPESTLRTRMRYRNSIHPQGAFYRKPAIRYSLDYRLCADYLFNLDHLARTEKIIYTNVAISRFCTEGASSNTKAKREIIAIAFKKFGFVMGLRSVLYHVGSHIKNFMMMRRHAD